MRMWNIKPKLMCRQHLLGEHFEIHKAIGNLKHSGIWTKALTNKGFLEPQNFLKRHDKIADEIKKRGMNHNSKLIVGNIKLPTGKVDIKQSVIDLKKRCPECRKNLK